MAVPLQEENAIVIHAKTLLAAALLLSLGSLGATAQLLGDRASRLPQSPIDRVQYDDGGRCYNSCISGRVFRRCQADERYANKENCCNVVCNRLNNDSF
jgi:hypothetical protein